MNFQCDLGNDVTVGRHVLFRAIEVIVAILGLQLFLLAGFSFNNFGLSSDIEYVIVDLVLDGGINGGIVSLANALRDALFVRGFAVRSVPRGHERGLVGAGKYLLVVRVDRIRRFRVDARAF